MGSQAKEYLLSESLPSGYAPHGSYYGSKNITKEFFLNPRQEEIRTQAVRTNMGFLFTLIHSKLEHHHNTRVARRAVPPTPGECDRLLDTEDPADGLDGDTQESQKLVQVFPHFTFRVGS